MKLKYYLRGVGVGIVVATLILMISFSLKPGMSDEQVMKRARQLGMITQEEADKANELTQKKPISSEVGSETQKQESSEPENINSNAANTVENENNSGDNANSIDANGAEGSTNLGEAGEPQSVEPQPTSYEITVVPGEVARQIAEDLASKGLVDDAENFRKYMGQKNIANTIHNGVYVIPVGATYDDIIRILSGR